MLTGWKCMKLLFARGAVPLAERLLALPVLASLLYAMLEAMIFTIADLRSLFYYLISGLALSVYYDARARE